VLVESLSGAGDEIALPEDESRYVARVCRARVGERLTATDGEGTLAQLSLTVVGRVVRARIESLERHERSSAAVVWCGTPEGERADWLIEKLAELGVARFQPLDCEKGRWKSSGPRWDRMSRLAKAALRQSRQCRLMKIEPPLSLAALIEREEPVGSRWLADSEGPRPDALGARGDALGAIGPSPGFTPQEKRLLRDHGFRPISLAPGRLRTETAALAWAAWWAGSPSN